MAIGNVTKTTTGLVSGSNPRNFTHTPVGGDPKGVLVFVQEENSGLFVTGVTYGGVSMTEVTGSPVSKTTGENSASRCFFLGSSIPTGAQTVSVSGTTFPIVVACYSVTAGSDMIVQDTSSVSSDSLVDPSTTLSLGGNSCFCAMSFATGAPSVSFVTPLTNWTADTSGEPGTESMGVHSYDVIGTSDVTAGYTCYADDVTLLAVAIAESSTVAVDDINTDEIVEDAESGVTFTTSGFGGEITTATINDGTNSTSASNISSTSGAGTFDLPDVSGYASDTAGSPFTTASYTIQATLGDGTDTANLGVTYNPKTGWAVVEVASAVKTQGSVFENFVGTITDASQVLYPTSNNTSVSATGIITTDATQDIDMQFWDVTDGTWKPFTALIGSGNGDKQVQPVVSSFVLSMVSNTLK